ncbi:MAG: hypothetical protein WBZ19_22745 [Chthoniobacterales bacterium]
MNYTSGLPPSVEGLDFPPELPTPYTAAGMLGYLGMTTLQPKDIGTAYTYLHQDTRRRLRYDRSTRVYDCLRREQNLAPRIIPFPPGRTMFADYPGISCLATFI